MKRLTKVEIQKKIQTKKVIYFLRGLGVGIIIMTIISFFSKDTKVVINKNNEKYSYSGIQKLKEDNKDILNKKDKKATVSKEPEAQITKNKINVKENNIKENKDVKESKSNIVEIFIKAGMDSEELSRLLKKEGVVKDSVKINKYIVNEGYAGKIHCGKYKLRKNMDYDYDEIIQSLKLNK